MQAQEVEAISIPVARCRLYTFLAALLRYPDEALINALCSESSWEALLCGADELQPDGNVLKKCIEPIRVLTSTITLQELEKQYLAVFGSSPRGRIAAYECEYGNREIFQFASEMADIAAFYNAFGLSMNSGERADHIAAECEFIGVLCAKEMTVIMDHDTPERLGVVREGQEKFLREHLCQWAPAFAHQLISADADHVYGAAARLLDALVAMEAKSLGINCGPAYLPVRTIVDANDPSNCMSCGKQEGIPGAEDSQE